MVSNSELTGLYRSLYRRISYAPVDRICQRNLFKVVRHYFDRPLTKSSSRSKSLSKAILNYTSNDARSKTIQEGGKTNNNRGANKGDGRAALAQHVDQNYRAGALEYRYRLGTNFLAILQNCFISGEFKPTAEVLTAAFCSSVANCELYAYQAPWWLRHFLTSNNYEFLDHWPTERLKKDGNKLYMVEEPFSAIYDSKTRENKKSISATDGDKKLRDLAAISYDSGKVFVDYGYLKYLKGKPSVKSNAEMTEILANISKLLNFLNHLKQGLHKRSIPNVQEIIPLTYSGMELSYRRQRNVIFKKINWVKDVLADYKPFNYNYFLHIRRLLSDDDYFAENVVYNWPKIQKRRAQIEDDPLKFKDPKVYMVNDKFEFRLLKKLYIAFLSFHYSFIDNGKLTRLDTLSNLPVGDSYFFDDMPKPEETASKK